MSTFLDPRTKINASKKKKKLKYTCVKWERSNLFTKNESNQDHPKTTKKKKVDNMLGAKG